MWTLSRGPCNSHAERFASFGEAPVAFAEKRFFFDKLCRRFHKTLDIGAAYPLTVGVFALLFPSLLSFEGVRHTYRATGVNER